MTTYDGACPRRVFPRVNARWPVYQERMGLVADRVSDDAEPTPPEAQRWEFFLQHGVKPTCTFVRRREGAAWGPARIVVSYPGAQPALPPDPVVPWDPVLEDWLLQDGIGAARGGGGRRRGGCRGGGRRAAGRGRGQRGPAGSATRSRPGSMRSSAAPA